MRRRTAIIYNGWKISQRGYGALSLSQFNARSVWQSQAGFCVKVRRNSLRIELISTSYKEFHII